MKFHLIKSTDRIPIPIKDITHIGIHHSASAFGSAELIDSWHRGRGFDGIGYHFVIHNGTFYPMGFIETGRDINKKPAAHKPRNSRSIAICVIGNFDETVIDNGLDSRAMSLALLVNWLCKEKKIPPQNVLGHREINPTHCPGLNIDLYVMRQYFKSWAPENTFLKLVEWYEGPLFVYTGAKDQVATIQIILNRIAKAGLSVDGILGPLTHGAWTDEVGVETFESMAGQIKGWELITDKVKR